MNIFLKLTFLFCIGSLFGWVLELFYRRFFSDANPERKWINPGLCQGPYLPLYGTGLCTLYLIASAEKYSIFTDPIVNQLVLFIFMAISMTLIEYLLGYLTLTYCHVRLWDYRNEWGNIQGLICPKFSLYWSILGAMYYFLIHPHILESLDWLANNLGFSFGIGLFFGVFGIDFIHATNMLVTIRKFADEHDVVVKFEEFKENIRKHYDMRNLKYHFFQPLRPLQPIQLYLKEMTEQTKQTILSGIDEKKAEFNEAKEEFRAELNETRDELEADLLKKIDDFKKVHHE